MLHFLLKVIHDIQKYCSNEYEELKTISQATPKKLPFSILISIGLGYSINQANYQLFTIEAMGPYLIKNVIDNVGNLTLIRYLKIFRTINFLGIILVSFFNS